MNTSVERPDYKYTRMFAELKDYVISKNLFLFVIKPNNNNTPQSQTEANEL